MNFTVGFISRNPYPDEFRRLTRQSEFHIFRGDGRCVTPRDEIVYGNFESWEMT